MEAHLEDAAGLGPAATCLPRWLVARLRGALGGAALFRQKTSVRWGGLGRAHIGGLRLGPPVSGCGGRAGPGGVGLGCECGVPGAPAQRRDGRVARLCLCAVWPVCLAQELLRRSPSIREPPRALAAAEALLAEGEGMGHDPALRTRLRLWLEAARWNIQASRCARGVQLLPTLWARIEGSCLGHWVRWGACWGCPTHSTRAPLRRARRPWSSSPLPLTANP
jgi:hypothetical protein